MKLENILEQKIGKYDIYYDIQGDYGHGWETVTSEDNLKDARQTIKDYRENEPGIPFKLKRVKEKL